MFVREARWDLETSTHLLWRVFTGEDPGPAGVHGEVPAGRSAAVQAGPGDNGPAHVTKRILFGEGVRARGEKLLGFLSSWKVLLGVVLLRQRRLTHRLH